SVSCETSQVMTARPTLPCSTSECGRSCASADPHLVLRGGDCGAHRFELALRQVKALSDGNSGAESGAGHPAGERQLPLRPAGWTVIRLSERLAVEDTGGESHHEPPPATSSTGDRQRRHG